MFVEFINKTGYTTDAEKAGASWVNQDGDWKQVEGADWEHPFGPSSSIFELLNHPVVEISWNDAQAYCSWVNRHLPTEAQWEKAASGGIANVYPWGDTFDGSLLNFCDTNCLINDWKNDSFDDGFAATSPVGSYPDGASPYRALDMAGNVWEWVEDWYDAYTENTKDNSSYGTTFRVMRGGSWYNNNDIVRSAKRDGGDPSVTSYLIGFRCAMDAP